MEHVENENQQRTEKSRGKKKKVSGADRKRSLLTDSN